MMDGTDPLIHKSRGRAPDRRWEVEVFVNSALVTHVTDFDANPINPRFPSFFIFQKPTFPAEPRVN
jgi:hypothetical protein